MNLSPSPSVYIRQQDEEAIYTKEEAILKAKRKQDGSGSMQAICSGGFLLVLHHLNYD